MHFNAHTREMIGDWRPVDLPPILYLNTAALALSSITMEWARRSIFREIDVLEEWLGLGQPALRRALPWIAATFLLGSLFLAGQGLACPSPGRPGWGSILPCRPGLASPRRISSGSA